MENVLIYGSIFNLLDDMSDVEAGQLFKAINTWRKGEVVIIEDRMIKMIWNSIQPNLENIKKNYEKNIENGKKGGRPKKTIEAPVKKEIPIEETKAIIEVATIKEEPKIETDTILLVPTISELLSFTKSDDIYLGLDEDSQDTIIQLIMSDQLKSYNTITNTLNLLVCQQQN